MRTQRARFEAWFERRRGPRDPQLEAALLLVADAYDAVDASGELSPDHLDLIVETASSSHALLWHNGTELLGSLSEKWPLAGEAIRRMFGSRKSHVRFSALCSLTGKTPRAVVIPLLRAGLVDKSSSVRWKAADKAGVFGIRNLVPDLTAALASEPNEKARKEIELELRLLRDGYVLQPDSPSGYDLTVRVKNGICGRWISEKELKARGIETLAAELRKD